MKLRTLVGLSSLCLTAAMIPGAVRAQDSSQHMDSGSRKMMKSPDSTFAVKAAQGGLEEVKMGQLAADKASSSDVKQFGQKMVDDHTKANDDLKSVAQKEGMTLPTDMDAKQKAMYDRLSKLSGAQFDHTYVRMMVQDHEMDVKDFHKEADTGQDPGLKDFAGRTVGTLQEHLDMIKGIQSKM